MAARDNAASVQGEMIRITPLLVDGSIDPSQPILTTTGFITASFGTEFEDGDEISEKAANGRICIQYKADDSLTGITFNLTLCSPDPEASALIAGGTVIMAAPVGGAPGEVIGYSSPAVGDLVGKPIAVEIWSKAIINGKPAAGQPYFHWVFPYVRVRYEGDREFTNGALANEFSGTGVGNEALACPVPPGGLNPANPADDFVVYAAALKNPFSYVRTATLPTAGWSTPSWDGGGIGPNCTTIGGALASGATAGTPGNFTPNGSTHPADAAAATAGNIVASPNTAWTTGQYVQGTTAGAPGEMYWNGTAWTTGRAAAAVVPPTGATEVVGGAGTYVPANATPPADVTALANHVPPVTATPNTAWSTGSYIQTATAGAAGQAHWDGTAWVAGPAALARGGTAGK
jgi:hypothetical protein